MADFESMHIDTIQLLLMLLLVHYFNEFRQPVAKDSSGNGGIRE
jgi:hypothetical protein